MWLELVLFLGLVLWCSAGCSAPSDAGQAMFGWLSLALVGAVRLRGQRSPPRCAGTARLQADGHRRAARGRDRCRACRSSGPGCRSRSVDGLVRAPPEPRQRNASIPAPKTSGEGEEVIGLFPAALKRHARRHHRLRLGQPPLRRQGFRARRARARARPRDQSDGAARGRCATPSASCCRASAPLPIASGGSSDSRA